MPVIPTDETAAATATQTKISAGVFSLKFSGKAEDFSIFAEQFGRVLRLNAVPERDNIDCLLVCAGDQAVEMLESNGLEEVQDILQAEHALTLNMPKLVQLIGNTAYREALKKDGDLMLHNAITYEQIANLWNDLERPAFGAPDWNSHSVSVLLS